MARFSRWMTPLVVGWVALTLPSCGKPADPPVFPVTGKVFYKGKPAEGATVTLVPLDGEPTARRPGGQVRKDGSFRLSTFASYDGAPAGRYAVTIVYPSPARKVADENAGPDLLRGRYGDPKTTPLRVEVRAEPNALELFRLD